MHLLKLITLSGILAAPSFAQVILFEEDFSGDFSQWETYSPWHIAGEGDLCTALSQPPAGFGAMARMGDPDCTYVSVYDQPNFMMTSQPIAIPLYADNPRLTYDSYVATEGCNGWDHHDIYISSDLGSTWTHLGEDCQQSVWHSVEFDLSPWAGQDVLILFTFDPVDDWYNGWLGWLIDNVKVSTDACTHQNYCVAAANSASPTGAIIGHTGSKRLHINNFALTLIDGPPGQFAHFFYGPFETQMPLADGFLCIGTDAYGYRRLHPAGQIDANGYLEDPIDFTALTGSHTILPGMKLNFQCWYRDFENGVSTSNFSDALSITFCP